MPVIVFLFAMVFSDKTQVVELALAGGEVYGASWVTFRDAYDIPLKYVDLSKFNSISFQDTLVTDNGLQVLKGNGSHYLTIGHGNKFITLNGVTRAAKQMPELQHLTLHNITGDMQELSALKNLSVLSLLGPDYTDADIENLSTLTGLSRLVLIGTVITDEGLGRLKEALPKTKIVNVDVPKGRSVKRGI